MCVCTSAHFVPYKITHRVMILLKDLDVSRTINLCNPSCHGFNFVFALFPNWHFYRGLISYFQALECQDEGMEETERLLLYVYIGSGWVLGAWVFGFLAIQKNEECRISKLYLCQVRRSMNEIIFLLLGEVCFCWNEENIRINSAWFIEQMQ